jgi:hypothetical protein
VSGEPSPSCLLYLFADVVVDRSTWLGFVLKGQPRVGVPGTRARVQLGALERMLMAWAFWNLDRQDLLTLIRPQAPDKHQKDRLVHLNRGQGDQAVGGLESELLACWTNEGDDVALIIQRWAGDRGRPLPLDAVVAVARDEAADFGLWDKVESVSGSSRTRIRLRRPPRADRLQLEMLGPAFSAALTGWETFEENDPALAGQLVNNCASGLAPLRFPFGVSYHAPGP